MKSVQWFSLSFFLLIHCVSYAQTDTSFLSGAVNMLGKQPVTEKVYLHLNRPAYSPGDTIWYKAYTVIGQQHQLSGLSAVLYVELIDSKDSIVNRQTVPLVSGVGWSNINLPRRLKQGSYRIRGYTNWMRNAGPYYFYDQKIRIGGIILTTNSQSGGVALKPDVQFFPEGGELVNGVRSKVAVKAINSSGLGENISGTITDNEGNEVADFATQHLGMGVFALTPNEGKTYKAKITAANGAIFNVDLPKAQQEGFTLAINNSGADSIYIKIAANSKLFQARQNSKFYLVAQSSGKVYYASEGKLAGAVFASKIDKGRFPSGIVQFTLFSQSGEPVAERIAFIQNADTLKLGLMLPANTSAPRQKVMVSLDVKNGANQPVLGSFSAAVINESRLATDETAECTILNNLLLTSDLKGFIEQPNYYFLNPTDQTRADLDVLMLTQGYRRFEWKQVLSNTIPPINFLPEKSLELTGTIKTRSGKPVPNGKVTLVATHENILKDTITDANGNFKFTDLYLPDTARIVIRARKEHNGSNVAIYVKKPDYPVIPRKNYPDTIGGMTPQLAALIEKNNTAYRQQQKEDSIRNGTRLKEVTIKDKKMAKPDEFNRYGSMAESFIDMKKLQGYPSLDAGIDATQPLLLLPYKGNKKLINRISVIVDGLPFHKGDLYAYSPEEIESVGIITGILPEDPPTIVVTTKHSAGTDTTRLKEVVITAKKVNKTPELTNSQNLNGPGNADQVIMSDKVDGCVTLSDCLNGKIFGVTFKNGTPYSIRTQGRLSGSVAMVVIVDGNIMDGSHLDDLNANDIYSIEVLRSGAFLAVYGSNAPGGALVITTKRGGEPNYVSSEIPSGLITYPFRGFYKARVFYSPQYNNPKANSQGSDFRTAIYWKPNIITDKDGKASFEYFNADSKGTYRVVVEGIDDNGNLGRQIFRYKVE